MMLPPEELVLLVSDLKEAEGWRPNAYQDTQGIWTIGFGTNLQELNIDRQTGEKWLQSSLFKAELEAQSFAFFQRLNNPRKRVVIELIYNMGLPRLLGFVRMLDALEKGEYVRAAAELLRSKYATQVGQRAQRLAAVMRGPYSGDTVS